AAVGPVAGCACALGNGVPVAAQMRGEKIEAHRNVAVLASEPQQRRFCPESCGECDARLIGAIGPMVPAVVAPRKGIDRWMDRPVFAGEPLWAGLAPGLQDDVQRFQHNSMAGRTVDTKHDLVAHGCARTKAEVDPPPSHVVELGELRCDCQGMVLVEHSDAGAEHDPARLADRAGYELYRAGDP